MAVTKYRAYLCCGRNCGPKGSGALLDFLAEEVRRLGIEERVTVLPTGCQSHCESGPTMVVYPGPVYYQAIDQARLREIAAGHLRDDLPVQAYFWRGEPLRVRPREVSRPIPGANDKWSGGSSSRSERGIPPKRERRVEDVDDFKW